MSQFSFDDESITSNPVEPDDADTINTEQRSVDGSVHSSDDEWIDSDAESHSSALLLARTLGSTLGRRIENNQERPVEVVPRPAPVPDEVAIPAIGQNTLGRVPIVKGRGWCVVINNPIPEDRVSLESLFTRGLATGRSAAVKCDYLVYQLERGESGTLHIQGYAHFSAPVTLRSILLSLQRPNGTTHSDVRVAKGTAEQNRAYCTKVDSREPGDASGPYEFGEIPSERGKRNDLKLAIELVKSGATKRKLYDEVPTAMVQFNNGLTKMHKFYVEPRTTKSAVHWYYGPPGSGKTRAAFAFVDSLPPEVGEQLRTAWGTNLYYNKSCDNKWWCGYDGQPVVVLDDLRPDGALSLSYLLTLFDRYTLMNETKGDQVMFQSPYIVVTCPVDPLVFWSRLIIAHKVLPEEDGFQLYRRISEVKKFEIAPEEQPEDIVRAQAWINQLTNNQNRVYNFGN